MDKLPSPLYAPAKRLFDLFLALALLVGFSPLLAIVAWFIQRRERHEPYAFGNQSVELASITRRGVTSGPTVAANSVPPCKRA